MGGTACNPLQQVLAADETTWALVLEPLVADTSALRAAVSPAAWEGQLRRLVQSQDGFAFASELAQLVDRTIALINDPATTKSSTLTARDGKPTAASSKSSLPKSAKPSSSKPAGDAGS